MKVEFYYDSTVQPGATFATNNAKAVELVNQLAAKGVNAKAVDLQGAQVAFMTYNAALTGPKAQVRAVFGAKGALQEDFGKTVPALLVFEKEEGRGPLPDGGLPPVRQGPAADPGLRGGPPGASGKGVRIENQERRSGAAGGRGP